MFWWLIDCSLVKSLQHPFTVSSFLGPCILEVKVKAMFVVGKSSQHTFSLCSVIGKIIIRFRPNHDQYFMSLVSHMLTILADFILSLD